MKGSSTRLEDERNGKKVLIILFLENSHPVKLTVPNTEQRSKLVGPYLIASVSRAFPGPAPYPLPHLQLHAQFLLLLLLLLVVSPPESTTLQG